MKQLNEKEWKDFSLEDIFTVSAGKRLETRNKIPGNRPFIGATEGGNGVTGFVGNDNVSKDSNVLGVNYNGAPCIAFYHPYECIFTDDVKRLHLKCHTDNENTLLFFTEVFAGQRSKYSYGYKFKEKRMLRQKLMIPVNDDGEPDYNYMEEYTRQTREALLARYREYLENRIADLGEEVVIPALNEKTWKSFRAGDLFDIYTGGDMIVSRLAYGNIPLISHSEQNNGVVKYIKKQQDIKLFDCNKTLSLADRGNFCANIQSKNFYVGTRVKALVFKDKIKNPRNILKFISICINKQSVKFNYGNNCTGSVASLLIMLPVTDDGNPDYEYMEQYAKNVMHRKYKQYMTFLEKKSQSK